MMKDRIKEIAIDIGLQKENEIKKAISFVVGNDNWTISEITGRAEIRRCPDNTEVFVFDNVELLQFFPVQTEIVDFDNIGISLKATQKFRKLYA